MSESIVLVCPVCRTKLRLKGSVLTKATVPCPKCGTTLDVPKSETPAPPIPQKTTSAAAPIPPSQKTSTQASKPIQAASLKSAGDSVGGSALPYAQPPRKRIKPVEDIPNPYGDDVYEGSEDFFNGGDSDDLGSDHPMNYGAAADPYGSRTSLPPKKRPKTAQSVKSNAQSDFASDVGGTRRGGFLSWLGYGLLAAVAGIILQTLLGFTNYLFPLLIATIATGSMVGVAVRYAAGENKGWGPGIVAVLIAAIAIFAGRIGAFSVSPDVNKILGMPDDAIPLTPEAAEAKVALETTEPYLIADIAEEVEYDEEFLDREKISDEKIDEFWEAHFEEEDPSKRYIPAVWTEATQRWNQNPPEQKETIRKNKELELRESYGVMSDEHIQDRVNEATTEEAMIGEIANTLYEDEEWLTKAGISEEQIDEHWENTDSNGSGGIQAQHLAPVWTEAKRRWDELPPDQKQARIKQTADDRRADLVVSDEDAEIAENVGTAIRVLVIVFGALFTLFWGFGSLICSISALVGAFKLGFGVNAAK